MSYSQTFTVSLSKQLPPLYIYKKSHNHNYPAVHQGVRPNDFQINDNKSTWKRGQRVRTSHSLARPILFLDLGIRIPRSLLIQPLYHIFPPPPFGHPPLSSVWLLNGRLSLPTFSGVLQWESILYGNRSDGLLIFMRLCYQCQIIQFLKAIWNIDYLIL